MRSCPLPLGGLSATVRRLSGNALGMGRNMPEDIELRQVTHENWRDALRLAVRSDQQRFVAEYAPIVAIALAKAYLRHGGAT